MAADKSWMKQLQLAKAKEILLNTLGLDGFWVKITDPATKPYGWFAKLGAIRKIPEETSNLSEEELEEMFKEQRRVVADLIVDWNLTHPETGEVLPIPSEAKDGVSSLDILPVSLITLISDQIGELFKAMGPQKPRGD